MSSIVHSSYEWVDPKEFYINSPEIISAVMATHYREIYSCVWSTERYNSFYIFSTTAILAAQNSSKVVVLHGLKLVNMYMSKMKEESRIIESEYAIFLVAFRIAQKYHDDYYFSLFEIDLSMFTEMSRTSLDQFELKFLDKIDYSLTMNETNHFQWELCCYGYYISFIPSLSLENWVIYNLIADYYCVESNQHQQEQVVFPNNMNNNLEL